MPTCHRRRRRGSECPGLVTAAAAAVQNAVSPPPPPRFRMPRACHRRRRGSECPGLVTAAAAAVQNATGVAGRLRTARRPEGCAGRRLWLQRVPRCVENARARAWHAEHGRRARAGRARQRVFFATETCTPLRAVSWPPAETSTTRKAVPLSSVTQKRCAPPRAFSSLRHKH